MRTEFLGGVWGAVSDLNLYASIWFHSGSEEDAAARSLVQRYTAWLGVGFPTPTPTPTPAPTLPYIPLTLPLTRYGLLAHLLLYKDARGQTSLEDAIGKGLLLPHEANVLQPLPSRTQVTLPPYPIPLPLPPTPTPTKRLPLPLYPYTSIPPIYPLHPTRWSSRGWPPSSTEPSPKRAPGSSNPA